MKEFQGSLPCRVKPPLSVLDVELPKHTLVATAEQHKRLYGNGLKLIAAAAVGTTFGHYTTQPLALPASQRGSRFDYQSGAVRMTFDLAWNEASNDMTIDFEQLQSTEEGYLITKRECTVPYSTAEDITEVAGQLDFAVRRSDIDVEPIMPFQPLNAAMWNDGIQRLLDLEGRPMPARR